MTSPHYEVHPLFSIPLMIGSLEPSTFVPIIDRYADDPNWRANVGEGHNDNWISKDMNVLREFPDQRAIIQKCVDDYVTEVMGIDGIEMPITTSWLTKATEGGYAKDHWHTNAVVSGCYYFQSAADAEDGPIVFYDWARPSSIHIGYTQRSSVLNASEWWVPPYAGMIAIWPSYLKHRIGKSMSRRPRYSMAFNAFPTGTIGDMDSSITFGTGFTDA